MQKAGLFNTPRIVRRFLSLEPQPPTTRPEVSGLLFFNIFKKFTKLLLIYLKKILVYLLDLINRIIIILHTQRYDPQLGRACAMEPFNIYQTHVYHI